MVKTVLSLLGLVAIGYVVFAGLLFLMQGRMLFLPGIPGREIVYTPDHYRLAYEDIRFRTEDGLELHGWWLPAASPTDDTMLFFHGNAGNISHRLDTLRIWHALGYNVFIFDYRGYGQSDGRPSETGTYLDARAAWRWLTEERGVPAGRIVLFGRSMGGAIATELARAVSPAGLIVESTFTSVPDIAADLYWWLPVRLLARIEYPTLDHIAEVDAPILVIHSRDDEIIPFHHGRRLYEAAREPKRLLVLDGSHNTGFLQSILSYEAGLAEFLSGLR